MSDTLLVAVKILKNILEDSNPTYSQTFRMQSLKFCIFALTAVLCTHVCHSAIVDNSQATSQDSNTEGAGNPGHVLVFGGNGMLGSVTVDRLIRMGYNVTIVNRGNWYWDSKQRILPYVRNVHCDRNNGVTSCELLNNIIQRMKNANEVFDAVIDFSARGAKDINDTVSLLAGGTAQLYVYISSDAVYDVSDPAGHKGHKEPAYGCREEEGVRPSDNKTRALLATYHETGNKKLEIEEQLIEQRISEKGHRIPYVILRLPDVIGSRDTTYRFLIYQLWIKMSQILTEKPVTIPEFLVNYNNSFVFADDVASLITDKLLERKYRKDIFDQVFNVAWSHNVTIERLLLDISEALNLGEGLKVKVTDEQGSLYLYPTGRRGPIDSSKVNKILEWRPTEWKQAIKETVEFYERAMKSEDFETQRNEIIQIVRAHLYHENATNFYNAFEKAYEIDLSHFKPRDEL